MTARGRLQRRWVRCLFSPSFSRHGLTSDLKADVWTHRLPRIPVSSDREQEWLRVARDYYSIGSSEVHPPPQGVFWKDRERYECRVSPRHHFYRSGWPASAFRRLNQFFAKDIIPRALRRDGTGLRSSPWVDINEWWRGKDAEGDGWAGLDRDEDIEVSPFSSLSSVFSLTTCGSCAILSMHRTQERVPYGFVVSLDDRWEVDDGRSSFDGSTAPTGSGRGEIRSGEAWAAVWLRITRSPRRASGDDAEIPQNARESGNDPIQSSLHPE